MIRRSCRSPCLMEGRLNLCSSLLKTRLLQDTPQRLLQMCRTGSPERDPQARTAIDDLARHHGLIVLDGRHDQGTRKGERLADRVVPTVAHNRGHVR